MESDEEYGALSDMITEDVISPLEPPSLSNPDPAPFSLVDNECQTVRELCRELEDRGVPAYFLFTNKVGEGGVGGDKETTGSRGPSSTMTESQQVPPSPQSQPQHSAVKRDGDLIEKMKKLRSLLDNKLGLNVGMDKINHPLLTCWINRCISVGYTGPKHFFDVVKSYDTSVCCGFVWPSNYIAYRCRTCGTSQCMSLCSDCFRNGDHEGHDFNMFQSQAGGACDCGNSQVMKESGFCKNHQASSREEKEKPPADLLCVLRYLIPKIAARILHYYRIHFFRAHRRDNDTKSMIRRTADLIEQLNKWADLGALSHALFTQLFTDPRLYHYVKNENEESRRRLKEECKTLKSVISEEDEKNYEFNGNSKLHHDCLLDEWTFWLVNMEFPQELVFLLLQPLPYDEYKVQLLSNEALTSWMVDQENFLLLITLSLNRILQNHRIQNGTHLTLDCNAPPISGNFFWSLISDLHNMISHQSLALKLCRDPIVLSILCDTLLILQGMNGNERALSDHVEYESRSYSTAYTADIEIAGSTMHTLVSHLQNHESQDCILLTLQRVRSHLMDWFQNIRFKGKACWKMPVHQLLFHLPLHRFYTSFLMSAVRWVDHDVPWPSELFLRQLIMHPLQIQVGRAEISGGMWVRNGVSPRYQSYLYSQENFSKSYIDPDITLLQLCGSRVDPEWFVLTVFERFHLVRWLSYSPVEPGKPFLRPDWEMPMLEAALRLIVTVVTLRINTGVTSENVRRMELASILSLSDKSYSSILSSLPLTNFNREKQDEDEDAAIQEILNQIGDYMEPNLDGGLSQGVWRANENLWRQHFDPVLTHHRATQQKDFQTALQRYKDFMKRCDRGVSDTSKLWTPYRLATAESLHPRLRPLLNILHSRALHAIIYIVLHRAVHETVFVSETATQLCVFLLELALKIPKVPLIHDASNQNWLVGRNGLKTVLDLHLLMWFPGSNVEDNLCHRISTLLAFEGIPSQSDTSTDFDVPDFPDLERLQINQLDEEDMAVARKDGIPYIDNDGGIPGPSSSTTIAGGHEQGKALANQSSQHHNHHHHHHHHHHPNLIGSQHFWERYWRALPTSVRRKYLSYLRKPSITFGGEEPEKGVMERLAGLNTPPPPPAAAIEPPPNFSSTPSSLTTNPLSGSVADTTVASTSHFVTTPSTPAGDSNDGLLAEQDERLAILMDTEDSVREAYVVRLNDNNEQHADGSSPSAAAAAGQPDVHHSQQVEIDVGGFMNEEFLHPLHVTVPIVEEPPAVSGPFNHQSNSHHHQRERGDDGSMDYRVTTNNQVDDRNQGRSEDQSLGGMAAGLPSTRRSPQPPTIHALPSPEFYVTQLGDSLISLLIRLHDKLSDDDTTTDCPPLLGTSYTPPTLPSSSASKPPRSDNEESEQQQKQKLGAERKSRVGDGPFFIRQVLDEAYRGSCRSEIDTILGSSSQRRTASDGQDEGATGSSSPTTSLTRTTREGAEVESQCGPSVDGGDRAAAFHQQPSPSKVKDKRISEKRLKAREMQKKLMDKFKAQQKSVMNSMLKKEQERLAAGRLAVATSSSSTDDLTTGLADTDDESNNEGAAAGHKRFYSESQRETSSSFLRPSIPSPSRTTSKDSVNMQTGDIEFALSDETKGSSGEAKPGTSEMQTEGEPDEDTGIQCVICNRSNIKPTESDPIGLVCLAQPTSVLGQSLAADKGYGARDNRQKSVGNQMPTRKSPTGLSSAETRLNQPEGVGWKKERAGGSDSIPILQLHPSVDAAADGETSAELAHRQAWTHYSTTGRRGRAVGKRVGTLTKLFDPSTVLRLHNIGWFGGVRVTTCGHYLHSSCHQSYLDALVNNSHNSQPAVSVTRGEFLCPFCRQFSNTILPIIPDAVNKRVITSGHDQKKTQLSSVLFSSKDLDLESSVHQQIGAVMKDGGKRTNIEENSPIEEAVDNFLTRLKLVTYPQYVNPFSPLETSEDDLLFYRSILRINLEAIIEESRLAKEFGPLRVSHKSVNKELLAVIEYKCDALSDLDGDNEALLTWNSLLHLPDQSESSQTKTLADPNMAKLPWCLSDLSAALIYFVLGIGRLNMTKDYFGFIVEVLASLGRVQSEWIQDESELALSEQFSSTGYHHHHHDSFKANLDVPEAGGLGQLASSQSVETSNQDNKLTVNNKPEDSKGLESILCHRRSCSQEDAGEGVSTMIMMDTDDLLQCAKEGNRLSSVERKSYQRRFTFLRFALELKNTLFPANSVTNVADFDSLESIQKTLRQFYGWKLSEMSTLMGQLNLAERWRKEVVMTDAVNAVKDYANSSHEWKHPSLVGLPQEYELLFRTFLHAICPRCRSKPKKTLLCLICGWIVCLDGNCCRTHNMNEMEFHSLECGAGTCVYLCVQTSMVILVRGFKMTLWGSPYLDQHGEEDNKLKRGKPLFLSETRYQLLQKQWRMNAFESSSRRWQFIGGAAVGHPPHVIVL